jgi:hypothetical protein
MQPTQECAANAEREKRRAENRAKFAWATETFDRLNTVFGPLKVIETIDENGINRKLK